MLCENTLFSRWTTGLRIDGSNRDRDVWWSKKCFDETKCEWKCIMDVLLCLHSMVMATMYLRGRYCGQHAIPWLPPAHLTFNFCWLLDLKTMPEYNNSKKPKNMQNFYVRLSSSTSIVLCIWIRREKTGYKMSSYTLQQVCSALQYAHSSMCLNRPQHICSLSLKSEVFDITDTRATDTHSLEALCDVSSQQQPKVIRYKMCKCFIYYILIRIILVILLYSMIAILFAAFFLLFFLLLRRCAAVPLHLRRGNRSNFMGNFLSQTLKWITRSGRPFALHTESIWYACGLACSFLHLDVTGERRFSRSFSLLIESERIIYLCFLAATSSVFWLAWIVNNFFFFW